MSKIGCFGVVMGRSRSLKIAPFNRARTNSYYRFIGTMSLSCTVSELARYWLKITDRNLPHFYLAPLLGVTLLEFRREFWHQKTKSPWASVHRCLCDLMFSRFGTIPACDGRTYGQTDRHTTTACITLA